MGTEPYFVKKTTFSTTSDFVRMIVDSQSVQIRVDKFVDGIQALINASANQSKIRTVSTNAGISATDNTILCDCTSGNIILTLPAPSSVYDSDASISPVYVVSQKIDAGNTVKINPNSTENIYDGSAQTSIILSSGSTVSLQTDGTDWIVIGS